ncbi:winged helix DNA-binding domain-containing protein [Isoptericola sp. QY 916]|nr:winged helix DNA-binding domain-containing protein [Isoptericola sp. QY 916]
MPRPGAGAGAGVVAVGGAREPERLAQGGARAGRCGEPGGTQRGEHVTGEHRQVDVEHGGQQPHARDVARGVGIRGVGALKRALALLELRTYAAPDGRELVDLADAEIVPGDVPAPVRLLPRWDQLLVALDERSRIVDAERAGLVYRRNADVLPTLWVDGRVAGTWTLDVDARRATVHVEPFTGDAWAHHRTEVEAEAAALLDLAAADAPEREVTWAAEAARESGRARR